MLITKDMQKWLSLWDIIIYFILVPAILITIQLIPYPIKYHYFILHIWKPSISAMYLTNFVHMEFNIDPWHLLGNIIYYELAICCILLYRTNKQEIYIAYTLFLTILPFLISYASLWALKGEKTNALGFSGIVAAFRGYFVYVFYRYVKIKYISTLNFSVVITIGIFNIGIAILQYYPQLLFVGILALSVIIIPVYIWWQEIIDAREIIKNRLKSNKWLIIPYFFTFILLLFAYSLLKPSMTKQQINVVAHFVGYIFGFFFPLLVFEPLYYFKGGVW